MKQIITLGGGFSMEPDNPLLDLYILKQAKKAKAQICFIPTASGDSDNSVSFEKEIIETELQTEYLGSY